MIPAAIRQRDTIAFACWCIAETFVLCNQTSIVGLASPFRLRFNATQNLSDALRISFY
jgi:hypothetical protein